MGDATYTLDDERAIAERAEVVVRGLTSGTVTDGEAIKVLRAARLCATRATSTGSAATLNNARREITIASLALIQTLKKHGPHDGTIERTITAVEAWKRELAGSVIVRRR